LPPGYPDRDILIEERYGMHTAVIVEKLILGLKLGIEILAAIIILIGILDTLITVIKNLSRWKENILSQVRLKFSRYLLFALEFQLAADILGTSVAPTWDQLGKLAAIAFIRTFLNYFLNKEIESERSKDGQQAAAKPED